jgi:hypothetical protein
MAADPVGATDHEHQARWPGDERVAQPRDGWTNAITIRAPAAQVWPWLVQLGQGRGGLYGRNMTHACAATGRLARPVLSVGNPSMASNLTATPPPII